MKYLLIPCALILALAVAWPVMGQDDTMQLSSAEQGLAGRPPVAFSHARHSELYECTTCHHEYDEYFNNTGGDGGKCADCHQPSATAKNPTPLTLAFHQQCKSCHLNLMELGAPKTGPIMCGGCHVRPGKLAAKK
ncbi:MAG: cytochrome c family protein [Desulfarculaceae bacterium]|nr:cytochrome c family protein [Desulfarculaceae bacterium]MCF8071381.1 cytochrome c family protein [Desulfarculaceae bacterium]MCF8101706.1 cytochrome c family protein [Desulfarculaceae bacterium]MCF8116685.1 cytochrome c family protein [Desulfarculaceae bacterium]